MGDARPRTRVRRAAPGAPPRLLLLVHGYGLHAEEMLAFGSLADPERRFVIVAPRGPIDLPNGAAAWMLPGRKVPEHYPEAVALVDAVLDQACDRYGVSRSAAVVGGFSQGAMVAFGVALLPGRARVGAVVNWCGALPVGRGAMAVEGLDGLDVLWQTATRDEVIPPSHTAETLALARAQGAVLEAHEYDTTHAVSLELLADTREWLRRR